MNTRKKTNGAVVPQGKDATKKKLPANSKTGKSNIVQQQLQDELDNRLLLQVLSEVKGGNFSVRMPVDNIGLSGKICDTVNEIITLNETLVEELLLARNTIGKMGKLNHRVSMPRTAKGAWSEAVGSLNTLISDLVHPTIEIAHVISSVAKGDLSQEMTLQIEDHELQGEFARIATEVNGMVKQLNLFSREVTRVALEVGSEGKLGGQAKVKDVAGVWKDLTDSVNQMADNLTAQVRNIADVTTAVARGDLSKKITVDVKGEILELKDTINTMVDQLNSFSSEVTRVAREVGTEGKLGGQATVKGVGGVWKDLTDSVNQMAGNLTAQVRNIADVTTAVALGDLSRKITVDVRGEILELKNTINTMVDQLNSFASEVTRVALEVGTEGKLGGQAKVQGVGGTWKDLTDSVNQMGSNLTAQVRNIAEVTTAVAKGDLSRKITVDVKGEILELKNTINTMVDQLNAFGSEVFRVAREVGSEGKLGGQADVPGVKGLWKDLTDSVNIMASNLTSQVRNIAEVTTAVANGDLSRKIEVDVKGEILKLKNTINTMVEQLRSFASEVTRVAREVGTDGKLGGQAFVPGVAGTWKDLTDSVNQMTGNLTSQVRNIAEVTKAVASGDLSKKVTIDVKGEILDLKNTINTMVDQLNSFAFEVTRVAREVGTEGKLGGQAEVQGVGGTWKDLTDSVNMMAFNLTNQVRGIAKVVTSVATGNLKQKLSIVSRGEVAQLTETINEMIDTLAVFADQVTTVAREVGVEGRLGGQASVPGASGIWKNLTENVNQLAENLTTQVRAISAVASAVTKGDLTQMIRVEAKGEVEELKDTINQMIANLKETTLRNQEQDWLKSNLAKFTQMLQGQKDLNTVTRRILSELAQVVQAQKGMFYILEDESANPKLKLFAAYAYGDEVSLSREFSLGQGLVGQCAVEKRQILLTNVPGDYIKISSGLGEATPLNLIVLPVLFETQIKAVIELASFDTFNQTHLDFLSQLTESIGIVLNTIEANSRTEALLEQSQSLADELRRTNEELQDKAHLLVKQKEEVEEKNMEVEEARRSLEEKAEQLQLTSKYKSEFLANMSHELRTPLNSLLILAQQLYENHEGNLSEKQVRYAKTIHSCGDDLIQLINDILDLSKIESGYISTDFINVRFGEVVAFVETTFKHISESKNLRFSIIMDEKLPQSLETDVQRLNQILKNLLSNAFKFTEKGEVRLRIYEAERNWKTANSSLDNADRVVAFEIKDTGIGISKDKQNIIFEAFQQAEGSTSRKYGGTGLGLSISRGLADLLGGSIELESEAGRGSSFTLFLPLQYNPADIEKEIASSLKPGEYKLPGGDNSDVLHSVPTIRSDVRSDTRDLEGLNEIINETGDDRTHITESDKVILIVEDDVRFAKIMLEKAHEMDLKVVVATTFSEVFDLTNKFNPIAVTLDVKLPDASGWRVLDLFKNDVNLRHIPIHLISGEENRLLAMHRGARSFNLKPMKTEALTVLFNSIIEQDSRKSKRVLVVEDNQAEASQIASVLDNEDLIEIEVADNGKAALENINNNAYDCIIADYMLPDIDGVDFITNVHALNKYNTTPVIVYSAKDFSVKEKSRIKQYANKILLKGVSSLELLLEETVMQLHLNHQALQPQKRKMIEELRSRKDVLLHKTVLVVDDDVRNLFALTTAFERYQINTITAESGREAINIMAENNHIDIVLMDIMMPEMDGYETMQKIRREHKNSALPIIAVTAKAMKGDREKCLEAGASDYITKPLKIDQLLSLMRIWLYR
ncbi:MAG TPA: HAMP domain-containing protein [Chitinophaga sp.]|uniref:HAMP domain-containing protein n=1 Tax=Chitinophaga sp. TaxID=1869181 RepID=UPI002DB87E2D|nr:HAMP domain-containing protein [Chitinophaga sp.]HEU4553468.1 HAMP domain-containing protein [Chitinophaga sp.]